MLIFAFIFTIAAAFAQQPRAASSSSADEVFPHFADGDGWKSTVTLINMDSVPASYRLEFYDGAGRALSVPVRGFTLSTIYAGTLPVNGSITFETPGESRNLLTGWARVDSTQHLGGNLVFSRSLGSGAPLLEAVIPMGSYFESTFRMPFDNTNGFVTSMAMVHSGATFSGPETITATFYDEQGNRLHLDQFTMNTRTQQAFELPARWPQLANRRGVATFRASLYMSAFGLRFHPSGSFTTVNTLASRF